MATQRYNPNLALWKPKVTERQSHGGGSASAPFVGNLKPPPPQTSTFGGETAFHSQTSAASTLRVVKNNRVASSKPHFPAYIPPTGVTAASSRPTAAATTTVIAGRVQKQFPATQTFQNVNTSHPHQRKRPSFLPSPASKRFKTIRHGADNPATTAKLLETRRGTLKRHHLQFVKFPSSAHGNAATNTGGAGGSNSEGSTSYYWWPCLAFDNFDEMITIVKDELPPNFVDSNFQNLAAVALMESQYAINPTTIVPKFLIRLGTSGGDDDRTNNNKVPQFDDCPSEDRVGYFDKDGRGTLKFFDLVRESKHRQDTELQSACQDVAIFLKCLRKSFDNEKREYREGARGTTSINNGVIAQQTTITTNKVVATTATVAAAISAAVPQDEEKTGAIAGTTTTQEGGRALEDAQHDHQEKPAGRTNMADEGDDDEEEDTTSCTKTDNAKDSDNHGNKYHIIMDVDKPQQDTLEEDRGMEFPPQDDADIDELVEEEHGQLQHQKVTLSVVDTTPAPSRRTSNRSQELEEDDSSNKDDSSTSTVQTSNSKKQRKEKTPFFSKKKPSRPTVEEDLDVPDFKSVKPILEAAGYEFIRKKGQRLFCRPWGNPFTYREGPKENVDYFTSESSFRSFLCKNGIDYVVPLWNEDKRSRVRDWVRYSIVSAESNGFIIDEIGKCDAWRYLKAAGVKFFKRIRCKFGLGDFDGYRIKEIDHTFKETELWEFLARNGIPDTLQFENDEQRFAVELCIAKKVEPERL